MIETYRFREDIKYIKDIDDNDDNDDNMDNNDNDDKDNKDNNNYKDISALGLDRDMGFSRGHQGNQGH